MGTAPNATADDAEAARRRLATRLPGWAATPPEERARPDGHGLRGHQARAGESAPAGDRRDRRHRWRSGRAMQVPVAVNRFARYSQDQRHVAERPCHPRWPRPRRSPPVGWSTPWRVRQPAGVVACITSYNFPLVNMAGKVAPALAMGNTVVVKPAAQDPLAVVELVRILDEVGFPPGVVNLVVSKARRSGRAPRRVARRGHDQLHGLHRRSACGSPRRGQGP